jgi:hypothetical protein
MSAVYLETHPPARSQYRAKRRQPPSGGIVVHSAECAADLDGPDTAAESVAAFIARRRDPASYHSVVDSDSVCRVGRYEWEMFHEGTGGNPYSLGLSFACHAAAWPQLTAAGWADKAIRNGAREAAAMAVWVKATTGVVVPARRITAVQYRAKKPGFISHAELDPGRRSDPGAGFPWDKFLANYKLIADRALAAPLPPGVEMPSPATGTWSLCDAGTVRATVAALYAIHRNTSLDANDGEVNQWLANDLLPKLAAGHSPEPTINYLNSALAAE